MIRLVDYTMRRLELRTVSTKAGRERKVDALLVAHIPA